VIVKTGQSIRTKRDFGSYGGVPIQGKTAQPKLQPIGDAIPIRIGGEAGDAGISVLPGAEKPVTPKLIVQTLRFIYGISPEGVPDFITIRTGE
jgi:hypothetical protein